MALLIQTFSKVLQSKMYFKMCQDLIYNYFILMIQAHYRTVIQVSKTASITETTQAIQEKKQRKRWTIRQTKIYITFIERFREVLEKQRKIDKQKIYNKMEAFIQTRNSRQCKSHHQKMTIRYGSIQGILQYYANNVQQIGQVPNLAF